MLVYGNIALYKVTTSVTLAAGCQYSSVLQLTTEINQRVMSKAMTAVLNAIE